ncbi:hypothetical protein Efla_000038 [Eimeria flavescens]
MANPLSGPPAQAASNHALSARRSSGTNMHLTTSGIVAAERQSSGRGYKKLFFDCGLHLVLQQLLRRTPASISDNKSANSQSAAATASQANPECELTDAEVARLLRKHLNILVGSQEASDAEVVAAAKLLEQKFRPLIGAAPQVFQTAIDGAATEQSTETLAEKNGGPTQDSSRMGNLSGAAVEEGTRSWLGGFSVEASQTSDDLANDRGSGQSALEAGHPASPPEESLAGLVFLNSQESQLHETAQCLAPAEASFCWGRGISRKTTKSLRLPAVI